MLLPTLRRSAFSCNITRAAASRSPFVAATPARAFSHSPLRCARRDTQDKDSLKPETNEYSKSGSDDAAAAVEKAAFDPSQTRPEQEHATAEKESGAGEANPLEASPANHEISQSKNQNEGKSGSPGGGQVTKDRESAAQSGGSGAPKAGGKKSG